jgi:putative tryptophan/tyrosine transport system substrate-binding protein
VRRREFITLLGGAAAWPLASRAQQPTMPVIGLLSGSPRHNLDAFHAGLKLTGFVEGQNVTIKYRWAQGQYDQLPGLAAELSDRQVAVIVATSYPAALAAKARTATIPVVFVSGAESVQGGLVTSLSRPTGNLTGISVFHGELGAKRLELLRELVPTASVIGYLLNPKNPNSELHSDEVQVAAHTVTQQILLVKASSEKEIDAAFVSFVQGGVGALLIGDDPFFGAQRDKLVALAAQRAMPTMYFYRHFAIGGG